MNIFIGGMKVIDKSYDNRDNIYHVLIIRSLFLSVLCQVGAKDYNGYSKNYLNLVSICINSNPSLDMGTKSFSNVSFSKALVKSTAKDLLIKNLLQKKADSLSHQEIEDLAEQLIEEIFLTDQSKIDDKINLFI
jgi:hypothetical protein